MNASFSDEADRPSSQFTDILDELADRLSAGEDIDLSLYLERNPAQTHQIREAFHSLQQIFRVRDCLSNDEASRESPVKPLGDFQIVREIGRGGMGIVYEAQQLSLDRRVAVKVLPFTSLLSPRDLARFRNESRSAAMLRHPHIVGVHSIGCERGLQYYAMDLIQGGSFAHLIDALRGVRGSSSLQKSGASLPSHITEDAHKFSTNETRAVAQLSTIRERTPLEYCRSIARMGAQLADALHYAHEQGVTHRDIKPSNLLLDENGNPWIADFGLAQVQGSPSLTMTGDRLGTPRYMSPEQASGRKIVDHRTDIYSLGVTLFELLTLRPAYDADDRAAILRQIEEQNVPSIRSLNPMVPRDLETVLYKATSRLPEDRYDSAADLAMDLRRFLENRPVQARRVGRAHSVWRWTQRHRITAALVGFTFLLLIGSSTMGLWGTWKYRKLAMRERATRTSSDKVRQQLQSLLRQQLVANAEALEDVPGIEPLHQSVILATLTQYNQLLDESPDDLSLRIDVGRAHSILGRLLNLRYSDSESQRALRRAITLLEPLQSVVPNDDDLELHLAIAHFVLGGQEQDVRHFRESEQAFGHIVERNPDHDEYRSLWSYTLSFPAKILYEQGRWRDAEKMLNEAVEISRKGSTDLVVNSESAASAAWALAALGVLHATNGRLDLAEKESAEAMRLWPEPGRPTWGAVRCNISHAALRRKRAVVLYRRGDSRSALNSLRPSIAVLEEIVKQFPTVEWARYELLAAYVLHGDCHWHLEDAASSEAAYRQALEASRQSPEDALVPESRLVELALNLGRRDEAITRYHHAMELPIDFSSRHDVLQRARLCLNAADSSLRNPAEGMESARLALAPDDGLSLRQLGLAHYRAGNYEQALHLFGSAMERLQGGDGVDHCLVAMNLYQLGQHDAALRWLKKGLAPSSHCLTAFQEVESVRREAKELLSPIHNMTKANDANE